MISAGAVSLHAAFGAHAAIGTPIADPELAVSGGASRAHVFASEKATVLVFFRPGQARSVEALRELGRCRASLDGRSLRWLGVVPENAAPDAVASALRDAGLSVPVLLDAGDALYGSLGLSLHPVVVIADGSRRLAAFEPFRSVDFCAVVSARVRRALGEISDAEVEAALAPPAEPVTDLKQGAREKLRERLEGRK